VPSFALAKNFEGGVLDALDVEPSGEILLCGWSRDTNVAPDFRLVVDGLAIQRREEYRLRRPDVASVLRSAANHHGFGLIFHAPRESACNVVEVRLGTQSLVSIWPGVARVEPHYGHLFDEARVLHREDIYRYGPPMSEADVQVLELARSLPGSILDFGCGSGALVRALLSEGREAEGIELYRPEIVATLRDDVRAYVKLHEGRFPLPYSDGQFGAVVCSEVLEHIPDWQMAIHEIGRVAPRAVITVPDMSAIPTLFPHRVVPWHLLESTHVNFFTQRSLQDALSRVFSRVRFLRLGEFAVNGTRAFTSLVAECRR
jgi:ubiquinone/menaquinone biosynthesis C-methylase UbiE